MEMEKGKTSESKMSSQLTKKWPKITKTEVEDILKNHMHLRRSLKKHYQLDDFEAKRVEDQFFKDQDIISKGEKKAKGA